MSRYATIHIASDLQSEVIIAKFFIVSNLFLPVQTQPTIGDPTVPMWSKKGQKNATLARAG